MHRYLFIPMIAIGLAAAQDHAIAIGWTSPQSSDYDAAIDHKVVRGGHGSLMLRSLTAAATDYAARQRVRADSWRGKRIRLTGWVKPDQARGGGALWLRLDMANGDYVLDGMLELTPSSSRPGSGWVKCELVAEVPQDAIGVSFGLRMRGQGTIWADDLSFDVVSKSTPTNTIERRKYVGAAGARDAAIQALREEYSKAPLQPSNLNFEAR